MLTLPRLPYTLLVFSLVLSFSAATAQSLRIDSMFIDGPAGILTLFGEFGTTPGELHIGETSILPHLWTETLIRSTIPNSDIGASGHVYLQVGSESSNVRELLLLNVNGFYEWNNTQWNGKEEHYNNGTGTISVTFQIDTASPPRRIEPSSYREREQLHTYIYDIYGVHDEQYSTWGADSYPGDRSDSFLLTRVGDSIQLHLVYYQTDKVPKTDAFLSIHGDTLPVRYRSSGVRLTPFWSKDFPSSVAASVAPYAVDGYPNPTRRFVTLRSSGFANSGTVEVRVFDSRASIVARQHCAVESDAVHVDLGVLPDGVYTAVFKDGPSLSAVRVLLRK